MTYIFYCSVLSNWYSDTCDKNVHDNIKTNANYTMDDTEDADFEDIESRLYSQVYHASAESTETVDNTNSIESSNGYFRKKFRYFERKLDKPTPKSTDPVLPQWDTVNEPEGGICSNIQRDNSVQGYNCDTNSPLFYDTVSFSPNTTIFSTIGENQEQIQNNITVDQYCVPVVISSNDLVTTSELNHYLPSWLKFVPAPPSISRSRNTKKNRKSTEYRSNNIDLKNITKPISKRNLRSTSNTVTVYLSDTDSDDCIILDDMNDNQQQINTKFPKKYREEEGGQLPEPDDDIIFVPPPPVEVINVDNDEHDKYQEDSFENPNPNEKGFEEHPTADSYHNPQECAELLEIPESTFSNDFLDNSNVETNITDFNFGLHGSEFKSGQSEVLQPQKPTEYCETESSCSTNEQHSRDFSNTVKTIVFDEVEFPKEDIFSDKNLESFSSFITPKRSCPSKPNKTASKSTKRLIANRDIDISSDTSSSESDYESNTNKKTDNLPNLSPMVPEDIPSKRLKKSAQEFLKPAAKKTINEKKDDSFGKVCDIMNKPELVKAAKNKKNLSKDLDKSGTKKRRQLDNAGELPIENVMEESIIETELKENCHSSTPKTKKKKKKDISQDNLETPNENLTEIDESLTIEEKTVDDPSVNISDIVSQKTRKKKKKRDSMTDKDPIDDTEISAEKSFTITDLVQPSLNLEDKEEVCNSEKLKKKKKKRETSETNSNEGIPDDVDEICTREVVINGYIQDLEVTTDLSRNFGLKKKKKKKKTKENCEEVINSEILQEINDSTKEKLQMEEVDSTNLVKSKKKKKKKSIIVDKYIDDACQVTDNLLESHEIENTPDMSQNSNDPNLIQTQNKAQSSVSKIPDHSVLLVDNEHGNSDKYIVVDSDHSSEIEILSSDSEFNFEDLDEVDDDLTLNCSTSNSDGKKINISHEDLDRVIEHARMPLSNIEQFDIQTIQSKQSDDPDKWQISFRDRSLYLNSNRNKGPRCNRCRHFGHIGIRCPDKPVAQPCTLCGRPDHQEPRCPNKRCLQCGNPGNYTTTYCIHCFKFRNSLCMLCQMPGHIKKFCPDLWRRYHSTNDGPIVVSSERPRPRSELWCCGCARQGHLEHECDYFNRQFPPTTPYIMDYSDILNQPKSPQKGNPRFQSVPNPSAMVSPQRINPPVVNQPIVNFPVVNQSAVNPQMVNMPMVTPQIVNNMLNFLPLHGITMPHSSTHNMTIQVGNEPAPNDIVLQMMLNFNNQENNQININNSQGSGVNSQPGVNHSQINIQHINQNDQANIQNRQLNNQQPVTHTIDLNNLRTVLNFIMTMPNHDVYNFIQNEINYMQKAIINPHALKRKLIKYDKIVNNKTFLPEKVRTEQNFWFRTTNMFIFGINKQKDGGLHVNHLTRYLATGKNLQLDTHKRRSLYSSYAYIFGYNKRTYIDYYKTIRTLTRKYSNRS